MSANSIELLIITIVVCALFLGVIALIIESLLVVRKIRNLIKRAEKLITKVESAAEALKNVAKDANSHLPLVKLLLRLIKEHQQD